MKDPELLEKLDKEETGGYSVVAEKAEGIGGAWAPWAWRKLAKTHGFSMGFPDFGGFPGSKKSASWWLEFSQGLVKMVGVG